MQKAPERSSHRAVKIVLLALALSACLFAVGIVIGVVKNQQAAEDARAENLQKVAASAESVDLASDLRNITVDEVYEREAIPAYSYSQVWNMDMSKPSSRNGRRYAGR